MNSNKLMFYALIVITLLFAIAVSTTGVLANGTNQIVPKEKPFSLQLKSKANSVQEWIASRPDAINTFVEETKEYQAEQWAKGKDQTANNWKKIKYFFLGDE